MKRRNKEKGIQSNTSNQNSVYYTPVLHVVRFYVMVQFFWIVHQYLFPQENKYAIYIKVNGHLEMTKKVPYINMGAKKP